MWGWKRRDRVQSVALAQEAKQVLPWLTPELRSLLAGLNSAPPSVAEAVVQLLPFGSRAALLDQGVTAGESASGAVSITPLGYAVMELAAEQSTDGGAVDALELRAGQAAERPASV